jgi:hypothetical protein
MRSKISFWVFWKAAQATFRVIASAKFSDLVTQKITVDDGARPSR